MPIELDRVHATLLRLDVVGDDVDGDARPGVRDTSVLPADAP
jgi:hypothetical protein